MGIIAFIILGAIAGAIAKALMPGDDPGGWIVTTIIGIVGALLGGFLAGALFDADPLDEFFDISTWLTAIVGAIILLVIYRLIVGRRERTGRPHLTQHAIGCPEGGDLYRGIRSTATSQQYIGSPLQRTGPKALADRAGL